MTRLIFCACLLLAGQAFAVSREQDDDIEQVEIELAALQRYGERLRTEPPPDFVDIRGRHMIEDFEQFVLPGELEARIESLLERARGQDADAALESLEEARRLVRSAGMRAAEMGYYWKDMHSAFWRPRWQAFAKANGLPPEPADPQLLEDDRLIREELAAGDFARAAARLTRIAANSQAAVRNATGELVRTLDTADLEITPRKTACPKSEASGKGSARISRPASPDAYYPADARRDNEQGDIVLRAYIAPSGCAARVAIVVSSGYPRLDNAALEVFEATTFTAATENGVAVDGQLTFKVKFTLKDGPEPPPQ